MSDEPDTSKASTRTRAPRTRTKPVTPETGWTKRQALDLLAQGYTVDQVARRSGLDGAWLAKQRAPKMTLAQSSPGDVS